MGVIVPVVDIAAQYDKALGRVFNGAIFEVFEESPGYQPDEDFTFTFRLSLDLETKEGRAEAGRIRDELRERFPDDAESIIAVLNEHEWDVSFFADYF